MVPKCIGGFAVLGAAALLLAVGGCPLCPTCPEPNCPEPNCPSCPEPNCPDCNQPEPNAPQKPLHERIFTEILGDPNYSGTANCLNCHSNHALNILQTGHWNWKGTVTHIAGLEGETHGKIDLINNFCLAVPSNEGRCSQCHISIGWKSGVDTAEFFSNPENIDCLICHDSTGTYRKDPTANGGGGAPALLADGVVTPVSNLSELNDVVYNVGLPTRANCGLCHYYAGGGDNVKHGDLSSDLNNATFEQDVHMGGQDFDCQNCHVENNHKIAGTTSLYGDEGQVECTDCHDATNTHTDGIIAQVLNFHTGFVACQTCHIPTFSRTKATKVAWYWDKAGEDRTDIPTEFGNPVYDKMKGEFVWDMDIRPSYRWFDGQWARKVINVSDTFTEAGTVEDPVKLAYPTADASTEGAKIYPFKKMIGTQPADSVNHRLIVPHLFGTVPGPNPYWVSYDWSLALSEGAAYAGQEYSGEYEFVNTVMYLSVNHEIAPRTDALDCTDCHGNADFWNQIGVPDPLAN